jgi:hypothetical protein
VKTGNFFAELKGRNFTILGSKSRELRVPRSRGPAIRDSRQTKWYGGQSPARRPPGSQRRATE